MSRSRPLLTLLGVGLLALALPAAAVTVTEATGDVRFEMQHMSSPVPGWCYWTHDAAQGATFHATAADGDGSWCEYDWLAHCDGDSLVFRGSWPVDDWPYSLHIFYDATLDCTVVLDQPARLRAHRRTADGLLDDVQQITLTHPGGEVEPLFAAVAGDATVERDLPPGAYQVELRLHAYGVSPWSAYDGEVALQWLPGSTPVQAVTWRTVRGHFR